MKPTKIAAVASVALLLSASLAHAQPQTYKPGFGMALSSLGLLNLGYSFGQNNTNLVAVSAGYQKITLPTNEADAFTGASGGHVLPVVISYARYFQLSPQIFDNKLFWDVQPFYSRQFGSIKASPTAAKYKNRSWAVGLNSGLEYRLTSQIAVGGGLQVFSHTALKTSQPDTGATKVNNLFTAGGVYFSYQF